MAAPRVIHPADRISRLPEDIQAQILSFLPAQEAVRTCVLARTWRDVWKLTRRLLITGRNQVLLQEVRGFVDRLLGLRLDGLKDHGPIDACEIVFNWRYGSSNDDHLDDDIEITRALGRWIRRVLKCHVQSLRVDSYRYYAYRGNIPMRDIQLVSPHLTRLELSGLWLFEDCLDFSDCPVLEHLEITCSDLIYVRKVTSPSVKRLVIKNCYYSEFEPIQICFPLLVSLWLEHFYEQTLVLESMPQLAVASVSIVDNSEEGDSDDDEQADTTKCTVLHGLAEAKHLVLLARNDDMECVQITFTRYLMSCPTFSNLKTLVLNYYWCGSLDCSALACMLEHAPVLEKLSVLFSHTVKSKYDIVLEGRPNATGNSTMLSQHLKIVELKCFEVDQRVINVLKFLGFQVRVTEGSK